MIEIVGVLSVARISSTAAEHGGSDARKPMHTNNSMAQWHDCFGVPVPGYSQYAHVWIGVCGRGCHEAEVSEEKRLLTE